MIEAASCGREPVYVHQVWCWRDPVTPHRALCGAAVPDAPDYETPPDTAAYWQCHKCRALRPPAGCRKALGKQ